jgi:arabinan endo-1,5-alpha-L-arabinosidase
MQLGTGSFWGSADCYIDDLLVYNRVLSADDIKLLNILARRADTDYTAVRDILADKSAGFSSSGDDVIYDLSGRQIGSRTSLNRQLPKGIYIIQGRKVLIK